MFRFGHLFQRRRPRTSGRFVAVGVDRQRQEIQIEIAAETMIAAVQQLEQRGVEVLAIGRAELAEFETVHNHRSRA